MRALPPVEALCLFRAEESQEESETCRALGIVGADGDPTSDVVMAEPPRIEKPASPPQVAKMPDVVMAQPPPPPQTVVPAPSLPSQPPPPTTQQPSVPLPRDIAPPIKATAQIDTPVFIEEEKNEEMPAIDLGSDSDEE
jgi:hypothetical protein